MAEKRKLKRDINRKIESQGEPGHNSKLRDEGDGSFVTDRH